MSVRGSGFGVAGFITDRRLLQICIADDSHEISRHVFSEK